MTFVALFAVLAVAQVQSPSPNYAPLPRKTQQTLNGQWRFRYDAKTSGEGERWYARPLAGRRSFVPTAWQYAFKELHQKVGTGWYEREFRLDQPFHGRRIAVVFQGVNYYAKVWLNGQLVGEHEGGQLPFSLDVTKFVRLGGVNRITVKATDPVDQLDLPIGPAYVEMHRVSGIWRGVHLEATGKTFVSDLHVIPNLDKSLVEVRATVNSPPRDSKQSLTLRLTAVAQAGRQFTVSLPVSLPAHGKGYAVTVKSKTPLTSVRMWSPKSPHLYRLKAELRTKQRLIDATETHFGMRKIEIRGTQILLNNKPIFLRGVNDWQDTPDKNALPGRPVLRLNCLVI